MAYRFVFALALLVPLPAWGQTPDVNAMVHQGVELRRAHRDVEALQVFQHAWELSQAPRVLAQIALAELALGRWVASEGHLLDALGADHDPWISEHRAVLDGALENVRQHIGSLDVYANVPGAEVRLEGRRVGAVPFVRPARVLAGTTTLEVTAPGYLPVRRSVVVVPGSLSRETVTLLAVDGTASPIETAGTDVSTGVPVAAGDGGATSTRRVLAWTAAGSSLLVLGLGAVALVVRNNAADRWNARTCITGPRTREENCGSDRESAQGAEALSITGFAASGALAVVSAVLFITEPAGRERATARRFGCGVGPGDVGVTCGGTL
jgi:hypothetical protein